ncbi:hypothetical protein [Micromonospora chokoriensis]|uniref:hypothetical protein n=1 Tax=Micromonospora chokoriensis TaxID=356851 RepID=UPI0004C3FF6B|nr:hypothetical protein [Micromonospora chokoriensis]
MGAAEDRLRRTREVADVVAARRCAAAITWLDLVVARLAVGSCRILVAAAHAADNQSKWSEPGSGAVPEREAS